MTFEIPHTLMGWIGLIGIITFAFTTVYFQWKSQTTKLLRQQVDDMQRRITFLEDRVRDYDEVKFKKNYLKQLVIEALSKKSDVSKTILAELSNHAKKK